MPVKTTSKIKEIPILYSTPLVQALLQDRKFVTRRDRNLKVINENPDQWEFVRLHDGYAKFCEKHNWTNEKYIKCPFGKPGDVLWGRETWCRPFNPGPFYYKADFNRSKDANPVRWRSNMHMPKEAGRLWHEITEITIERAQDITADQAIAEGIESYFNPLFQEQRYRDYSEPSDWRGNYEWRDPVSSFKSLWININGQSSWDANIWIWAVKFKKLDNYVPLKLRNT